jgi:hypothetical protein
VIRALVVVVAVALFALLAIVFAGVLSIARHNGMDAGE